MTDALTDEELKSLHALCEKNASYSYLHIRTSRMSALLAEVERLRRILGRRTTARLRETQERAARLEALLRSARFSLEYTLEALADSGVLMPEEVLDACEDLQAIDAELAKGGGA